MDFNELALHNNTADHNFEMFVDEQRAIIDYKMKDDKVYLIHTEVPPELQGKGLAEVLVEKTFKYLEDHHLKLIPKCSYIQVYLRKHPEWDRILGL